MDLNSCQSFELVNMQLSAKGSKGPMCSHMVLGKSASAHSGQRCPAHRSQSNTTTPCVLGKVQPALHSVNEDLHLELWGEKDVKETKHNEMEAKCWQNSNCIGFILIGFLK